MSESHGWRNVPVLVTGGAGFIGSHLAVSLAGYGARVTVLDNFRDGRIENLGEAGDRVCVERGDVRDPACVLELLRRENSEVVFHLAANASVPGSAEDPAYDFTTNSLGTFVVLDAVRQSRRPARVVLASSGAVYGQPSQFPITEETDVDPISPYGSGKAGAELTARTFSRVYGLHVVIARIFNTYGPRMPRFVVLDFLRKLKANPHRLEILGDGSQRRDFTYVSDTADALRLLAGRGAAGEAYNISSGVSTSVTQLALALVRELGYEGQTELVYTGKSWPGDAQRWEVSIDKLCSLGYRPAVDLASGLIRTRNWYDGLATA